MIIDCLDCLVFGSPRRKDSKDQEKFPTDVEAILAEGRSAILVVIGLAVLTPYS